MEEFLELSSHFPFPHPPTPRELQPRGCVFALFLDSRTHHTEASEGLGMEGGRQGGNGAVSSHLCFIFNFTRIQVERPHYAKDERLGLAGPTFGGPAGNCLGSKEPGSTLWR